MKAPPYVNLRFSWQALPGPVGHLRAHSNTQRLPHMPSIPTTTPTPKSMSPIGWYG